VAFPPDPEVVLALDPGSHKCGLAVVRRGAAPGEAPRALVREVIARERVVARARELTEAHGVEALLVGDATGGAPLARELAAALAPLPVHRVNEAFTSERARRRFLLENRPRGLGRLVPPGLRFPDRPYDDYVALLLAEDFFAAGGG
jgi:RNase H-fold protein (predicted Holliday junction resolvase)